MESTTAEPFPQASYTEYRKTKSEMQGWLVAQKIVKEILKEDEQKKKSSCMSRKCRRKKKIDRIVDDGKSGAVWV